MTIGQNGEFILEERHITEGLTEKDFRDYAGYTVALIKLSELPHWDELDQKGELGFWKTRQRKKNLTKILKAQFGINHRLFSRKNIEDAALRTGSFVFLPFGYLPINPDVIESLSNLHNGGWRLINQRVLCDTSEGARYIVYPAINCDAESHKFYQMPLAGAALLEPKRKNEREVWSEATLLPSSYIMRHPHKDNLGLFTALHELRHLSQVKLWGPQGGNGSYFDELDADLFANQLILSIDGGGETILAKRRARYMSILFTSPRYWFAPALEAIENGREPPSFEEINLAREEICSRILAKNPIFAPKHDFDNFSKYLCWRRNNLEANPEIGYSQLKKINDEETLSPLAQQIAGKIIASAEYFCPGISGEKIKGPNRFSTYPKDLHKQPYLPGLSLGPGA